MNKSSIVIYGYGKEGKSVESFITSNYPQAKIYICDKNKVDKENYITESELTEKSFDLLVKSPGIPTHNKYIQKCKERDIKITSLTNIFFKHCKSKTIGITGTKGKSTTSALLFSILKQKFDDVRLVGNIGKPTLDEIETHNENTIFVIEMSSYQLEALEESPDLAILLEVFPEHLDYHQSFENYLKAKLNICKNKKTKLIAHKSHQGLANKHLKENKISYFDSNLDDNYKKENIHNSNISAAVLVAKELSVEKERIKKGIKEFTSLEHRLEKVGEFAGITFYNDSLATIPEATIFALDSLGDKVETLIAGGKDRGISYEKLSEYISNSNLKNLILFPNTNTKIKAGIVKTGSKNINIIDVENMEDAVALAFKHTSKNKICLLSPASSSLNLFKNYKDRGEQFIQAIESFLVP